VVLKEIQERLCYKLKDLIAEGMDEVVFQKDEKGFNHWHRWGSLFPVKHLHKK
jgi:hypothetical protein